MSDKPQSKSIHNSKCFDSHVGVWCVEPTWFGEAVAHVKAGNWPLTIQSTEPEPESARGREQDPYYRTSIVDGVAVIDFKGFMMKGNSKYSGNVSTVKIRQSLRALAEDKGVNAIMLKIESPGGHSAGTKELADEVKAVDAKKPVYAHIEDQGASAAYWVASQARRITANAPGWIGSIGTFAVLQDASGLYETAGVKVHVVSTGKYKGAGIEGTEITPDQLAYVQDLVNGLNGFFLEAIGTGRNLSQSRIREVSDGRVHSAEAAVKLGLIDAVKSFDEAMQDATPPQNLNANAGARVRRARF